jgi:imidazolonepropionase-like amidohydrolase
MAAELNALIKSGYSPSQALKALTSEAAKLLGMKDKIGVIKQGLKADLVIIDGDPFKDIYAIEKIKAVIYEGNIVFSQNDMNIVVQNP